MMQLRANIDKSEVVGLPIETFDGRIIVIQTESEANKAVDFLMTQDVVGLDTETRPSFVKGRVNTVSLLQVSTSDTCFLFRLNMIGLCTAVRRMLEDVALLKVGLSLKDDFLSLHRLGEFEIGHYTELQHMVKEYGIEEQSLQKVYALLFGKKISKTQRLSNWDTDVLTDKQKMYAAIDAWACLRIFKRLKELSR